MEDQQNRQQSMAGMGDNSASIDPALESEEALDELEEEEEIEKDDDEDPIVTQEPGTDPMRDA